MTPPPEYPPVVAVCCKKCGCLIYAMIESKNTLNDPEAHEEMAKLLREGFTAERMDLAEFRKLPFGCTCAARRAKEDGP